MRDRSGDVAAAAHPDIVLVLARPPAAAPAHVVCPDGGAAVGQLELIPSAPRVRKPDRPSCAESSRVSRALWQPLEGPKLRGQTRAWAALLGVRVTDTAW